MDKADDGKGSDLKMVGWRGWRRGCMGGGGLSGWSECAFYEKGLPSNAAELLLLSYSC